MTYSFIALMLCSAASVATLLQAMSIHRFNDMTLFEWYDVCRKPWMMKRCLFCWGFYLNVLFVFLAIILHGESMFYLLAAFPAAAITHKIIN